MNSVVLPALGMNISLVVGFAELEATLPGRESLDSLSVFPAQVSSGCCLQIMYV